MINNNDNNNNLLRNRRCIRSTWHEEQNGQYLIWLSALMVLLLCSGIGMFSWLLFPVLVGSTLCGSLNAILFNKLCTGLPIETGGNGVIDTEVSCCISHSWRRSTLFGEWVECGAKYVDYNFICTNVRRILHARMGDTRFDRDLMKKLHTN